MNKIELGFYTMKFKNEDVVKVIEDISLSVVEFANIYFCKGYRLWNI